MLVFHIASTVLSMPMGQGCEEVAHVHIVIAAFFGLMAGNVYYRLYVKSQKIEEVLGDHAGSWVPIYHVDQKQ